MIKKSILFCLILFFAWFAFLKLTDISVYQHQWQENIINAEKFMFDTDSVDKVLLGSSLTTRFVMDSLPGFYNLALRGQSVYDGLKVVESKRIPPKQVFIEVNYTYRGENTTFNRIIGSSFLNVLKANLLPFRSDKQPVAVAGDYLLIMGKSIKEVAEDDEDTSMAESEMDPELFNKLLNIQKDEYSEALDEDEFQRQLKVLESHIEDLQSKGVEVILYEMPINKALAHITRAEQTRELIAKIFPDIAFIDVPDDADSYITSDGIHLRVGNEAARYTHYFKNRALRY